MTDLRDLIAETLAAHADYRIPHRPDAFLHCNCGQWSMSYEQLGITEVAAEHRRHVADVLLATLGDRGLPEGGELQ